MVPDRIGKKALLESDARDAISLLNNVLHRHQISSQAPLSKSGNVTLHDPGSMPTTRANPLPSRVPSATDSPSGSVIRYLSPGTGWSSSSTISISIQLFFCFFSSSALGGLCGLVRTDPYLPVLVCRCSALICSTSPGSALSASWGCFGSAGETAEPAVPLFGLGIISKRDFECKCWRYLFPNSPRLTNRKKSHSFEPCLFAW